MKNNFYCFSFICALFCRYLEGYSAAIQELLSFLGIGTKQPGVGLGSPAPEVDGVPWAFTLLSQLFGTSFEEVGR